MIGNTITGIIDFSVVDYFDFVIQNIVFPVIAAAIGVRSECDLFAFKQSVKLSVSIFKLERRSLSRVSINFSIQFLPDASSDRLLSH